MSKFLERLGARPPASLLAAFCLAVALMLPAAATAQERGDPATFNSDSPVIGGACPTCPWGAIATIVRTTMDERGWSMRQCYTCSAEDSVRIVSQARHSPADRWAITRRIPMPPSPDAPVDLGVTSISTLANAYHAREPYTADGPYDNLRAIARIEHPQYLVVAVRRELHVTDLAQIRERRLPVRVLTDGREVSPMVLQHYGLDRESLESWGGELVGSGERDDFDVIIFRGYLGNTPESDILYEVTPQVSLRYLELPGELLARMVERFPELHLGNIPLGYFKGIERPIPTVVRTGQVVYGRDTMPDQAAYDLARALDENREAFIYSHIALSYDPAKAGEMLGVPLHAGAERYYRERGYVR